VTTGQLEIRLIDQNKTVQRRPYRLSVEEKAKVRHLIQQRLVTPPLRGFVACSKKKWYRKPLCGL